MNYLTPATADLFRSNLNLGLFFRLDHPDTAGILRLWLGVGQVNMKMTGVETSAPFIYFGAGRLTSVPDLDVIINGGASRIEVSIEGVSDEANDRINADPPDVVGRRLHIGMAVFDVHWQPVMDILPLEHAIADYWRMTGSVATGSGQQTRTLSLSAAVGETGRARPRRATYTQAQQQFRFPTDDFCMNVARYDRGFTVAWPRFNP